MKNGNVVQLSHFREDIIETPPKKSSKRRSLGGSIYPNNGILWVDFRYLGQRVRESSGLANNSRNRNELQKQLNRIVSEIKAGVFVFAEWFSKSKKKDYFTRLEGRDVTIGLADLTFGKYYDSWWARLAPGISVSKKRDYTSILNYHLLPYFGDMSFDQINLMELKTFLAHLTNKKNEKGDRISAKTIRNVFIPLHQIIKDACDEFGWERSKIPLDRLKLPKVSKTEVNPFSYEEWAVLMAKMHKRYPWYRPYFEFAVLTGLRPSEQVALKWTDIDDSYIQIKRSRVRNYEKKDLKTESSRRSIELNGPIRRVLEEQRIQTVQMESEYIFINTRGRPILQDKLRENWGRLMGITDVKYRRMYETRHTFASWTLAAGETPHWVAKTMGHVDTTMIFTRYSRFIPNLTRNDGSAFER